MEFFLYQKKPIFIMIQAVKTSLCPNKIKYGKISFLHLKNLKSDQGLKNYTGYGKKYIEDLQRGTEYISLPKKYRDTIKNAL